MVRETHQDAEVIRTLDNKFVPVRLEGPRRMDLVKQFEVRGAPTTILFAPNGEEKHRFVGFKDPKEYLQELEKVN